MRKERKTKKFRDLLLQYEAMINSGNEKAGSVFVKLMQSAKNFADWSNVYILNENTLVRKEALSKMKSYAIHGLSREEIQLNVLELFTFIDSADKDEILKRYLERYHKKEDFLFALDETNSDNDQFINFVSQEAQKYGFNIDYSKGIDKRVATRIRLLAHSTFDL